MRRVLSVLAAVALLACQGDGPLSAVELREITRARARWLASSVREAYVFDVQVSCFCPVDITEWNTVTVVNDSVVNVVSAAGVIRPESTFRYFTTVDRLFASLTDRGDDSYLSDIRVRFDPTYGYPVLLEFVSKPDIADGGSSTQARNLKPITFWRGP